MGIVTLLLRCFRILKFKPDGTNKDMVKCRGYNLTKVQVYRTFLCNASTGTTEREALQLARIKPSKL